MKETNKEKDENLKNGLSAIRKELREIKVILFYATIIFSVTILGILIGFLFMLIKFK